MEGICSELVISYLKIRYFPLKSVVRRADNTHKFYADRRITSWTKNAEKLMGLKAEEKIGG